MTPRTLPALYARFNRDRDALFRKAGVGKVSDGVVATALECARETVAAWRKERGVKAPQSRANPKRNTNRDAEMLSERMTGASIESLAVRYGISSARVWKIVKA